MNTSPSPRSWRRWFAVLAVLGGSVAAVTAGCGSDDGDSIFGQPGGDEGGGGTTSSGDFGTSGTSGTSGASSGDANPDALGTLVVTPATATISVSIVDGVVTANAPVSFTASYNGSPVAAT